MKLHQKGWLLVQLSQAEQLWDYELVAGALREYNLAGSHWVNTLRIALDELAAGSLIERINERLDDGRHIGPGKLLFCYRLTAFGRTRMIDTGLLPA